MDRLPFSEPVRVRSGTDSSLREVKTVHGASEFLTDWPQAKRSSPLYQEAAELCHAVALGKGTAEEARVAFITFAAEVGILIER